MTGACGTPSGYRRHRRDGERPCFDCRLAMSRYDASRRPHVPCVDCGALHDPAGERCAACAAIASRKSVCVRGHARTPENLNSSGGCKPCHNLLAAERRERIKAQRESA